MEEELKTIETVDTSPFKHLVMTLGELPTSFVDSMTYYECLAWLVNFIQNTVIPTVNNNAEAVEELQTAFVTLKSYVDERFDELDIPKEVKTTLDTMVEDGEFDAIIAAAIPNTITQLFDNVATMKTSNLGAGQIVQTKGFYSINDGGSANYIIENSGSADNIFSHELDNGLIAKLVNTTDFNVLQVGCKKDADTFDNATILATLLKGGLNNTTIRFPAGTYYTSTINYVGYNLPTDNFKMIGENATIKMLHTNKEATLKGTYDESFTVSYGFDELDFGTSCTVNTIKLEDGKVFFYLAISNATLIPNSLAADMVIKGKNSGFEAYIASIDKEDPDGTGTARIYLYAGHNERTKNLLFDVNGSTLNETLIVKNHLGNDYLYIRFNDNVIPSYIAVNNQIKQGDKTARVNNISIVYETIKYIELNCMPEIPVFDAESLYLESGVTFDVYEYSHYTAGLMSLNKFTNSSIEGITFDGNNLEVSKYEGSSNNWNSLITGASKNITIKNCKFINSIMAGIQIGGMGNSNAPARHDFPENILLSNCYFYNNGRGDIEVINGRHINIEYCNGNGVLDIETNSSEILENITINGCTFDEFTPYSPATSTQSTEVSVINSVFNKISCHQKINLNLVNCVTHYFQPYASVIHATNCAFDFMNGYHGNETMFIENSSFYGLYQSNPASQFGKENIYFNNCIIDLSLTPKNSNSLNRKTMTINNSYVVSSTIKARINDNRSTLNVSNTTFKNVLFSGAGGGLTGTKNTFKHCSFLVVDNTVVSGNSDIMFTSAFEPTLFEDCYFEAQIQATFVIRLINCIVNEVTKPYFASSNGITVSGLKTRDGSGISWNWIGTPTSGKTVLFNNVEFSPNISQTTLGIKAYSTPVSTSSVSDGCTGYFVGSTAHALVQMYHDSGNLAVRYVDFA